jgi:hypothetical protein
VTRLQEEIRRLEARLAQSQSNEASSKRDAEARIFEQRGQYQAELTAKETAKTESDGKLLQCQERMHELSCNLKEEISILRQQLQETKCALEKSELERRRIEASKESELDKHKKMAKKKMEEKFEEQVRAYRLKVFQEREERAQPSGELPEDGRQDGTAPMGSSAVATESGSTPTPIIPAHASVQGSSKSRRKVDRRAPAPTKSQRQFSDPESPAPLQSKEATDGDQVDQECDNGTGSNTIIACNGDTEPSNEQRMSRCLIPTETVPETQDMQGILQDGYCQRILPETQEIEVVPETQLGGETIDFDEYVQYVPETQEKDTFTTTNTVHAPGNNVSTEPAPVGPDLNGLAQAIHTRRSLDRSSSVEQGQGSQDTEHRTQETAEMLFSTTSHPASPQVDHRELTGGTELRTPSALERKGQCSPLRQMCPNTLEHCAKHTDDPLCPAESPCQGKSVANMSSRLAPPTTKSVHVHASWPLDNASETTSRLPSSSNRNTRATTVESHHNGRPMSSKGHIKVTYGRNGTGIRDESPLSTMDTSSQKRKGNPGTDNSTPKRPRGAIEARTPVAVATHQAGASASRIVQSSQSHLNNMSQGSGGCPNSRAASTRRTKSIVPSFMPACCHSS